MIHKDSMCWPSVESTVLERIEVLHAELESCPVERVVSLQGEIRALRWLLGLGDPPHPRDFTPIGD